MNTSHPLVGATGWEQEMYDYLLHHGEIEEEILEEYQRVAEDEESSAAFRYVAGLILDDEIRHPQIFADLAESVRGLGLVHGDEPIPPARGLRADRDRVLELTDRFLEIEHADAKDLKALSKRLKAYNETTLWVLLVDLMRQDSMRHIKILEFVRDRANDTD